ncbi:potassium channel family protein [Candidatus Poriferisodalis sp.]|uniref:potassium channel family protein n=1 Tax=Candidatus Poriferisodalis sp. TaxID=3101277 RepID=UPI003AF6E8D0
MLSEAKDASELMVDLAYAALYFDDEGMADAVLGLEENMSNLVHEMRSLAMLAVRHPREVDGMSSVLQVVSSIEQIANAAVDISKIVLHHLGIPRGLIVDLAQAAEVSHRLVVAEGSHLANRPLRDMELPVAVGMRVVAIQRGRRWLTDVRGDSIIEPGDVLFMRGDPAGIVRLRELAAMERWNPPEPDAAPVLSDLDRAVDTLVEMKNLSEAAIGLAYSALVLDDLSLAREVRSMQERLDGMKVSMQTWVLRAAADMAHAAEADPAGLRGLLHVAEAAEDIGDQARNIVSLVLEDEDIHPVLALALGDTDDVVVQVPVAPGSEADDSTLGSLGLPVDPGYHILAIRRAASYIYNPPRTVRLWVGDELIASGPEEGRDRLAAIFGYSMDIDEETGHVELTPVGLPPRS